jgi:flagellin-like protein
MQLTNLFDENDDSRAVSPVIGVILMVAITVILAAVIGTFVLGLGDSVESAPQASITFDGDATNGVTITHRGGDAMAASDIQLRGAAGNGTTLADASSGVSTQFSAGSSASVGSSGLSEGELIIVYTGGESDAVIASYDVPAE